MQLHALRVHSSAVCMCELQVRLYHRLQGWPRQAHAAHAKRLPQNCYSMCVFFYTYVGMFSSAADRLPGAAWFACMLLFARQ